MLLAALAWLRLAALALAVCMVMERVKEARAASLH
jgi:hypothetical protein